MKHYFTFVTQPKNMILKSVYFCLFICCFGLFSLTAQEAKVTVNQDKDITKLLAFKKDLKSVKIYKIQIFQSINPEMAEKAESEFIKIFKEWPTTIQWQTPNYKVWVGDFATRLEADRALFKIKKTYPDAIIFQPKT